MFSKGAIIIQNDLSRPFSALPQFANNTRNLIPMTLHESITNSNLFQQNYVGQQGKIMQAEAASTVTKATSTVTTAISTVTTQKTSKILDNITHLSLSLSLSNLLVNVKEHKILLTCLSDIVCHCNGRFFFFYNKRKSKYDLCLQTVQ